ncbi:atp-citrate synthase alpha chain protein 2 [Quercus suber]|uniref:Atp-citrate synthase alpha chain protein 2 n=1 Tax=Quercus suber TaxID=58331 RepID=A0AAW0L7W1_QUESU
MQNIAELPMKMKCCNMPELYLMQGHTSLVIGGGIANFIDVAATFNGIIRALKEKESKLKAARVHIYVRRGGPNYQKGLAKMRGLGEETGIPIEFYGLEATMTGI